MVEDLTSIHDLSSEPEVPMPDVVRILMRQDILMTGPEIGFRNFHGHADLQVFSAFASRDGFTRRVVRRESSARWRTLSCRARSRPRWRRRAGFALSRRLWAARAP